MGIDTLCLQPALGSSQFPKASLRRSSSQRRHYTTELEPNLLQSVCSTWTSALRQELLAESLRAVFPYAAPKVSFKIRPESVFANRSTNANRDVGQDGQVAAQDGQVLCRGATLKFTLWCDKSSCKRSCNNSWPSKNPFSLLDSSRSRASRGRRASRGPRAPEWVEWGLRNHDHNI